MNPAFKQRDGAVHKFYCTNQACASNDFIIIDGVKTHVGACMDAQKIEVYKNQRAHLKDFGFQEDEIPIKVSDPVNHPSHYTKYKGVEIIEITRHLYFNPGNAVKYFARAGEKDASLENQDLNKGIWYLKDEIEILRKLPSDCVPYRKSFDQDKVDLLIIQMSMNRGAAVDNITAAVGRTAAQIIPFFEGAIQLIERDIKLRESLRS